MFFGREWHRYPEILWQMLGKSGVSSKASSKWFRPLIKIYIRLFGLPNVSWQLKALYFRRFIKAFRFDNVLDAGCGIGLFSVYLAKKYPKAKVDACDLDNDYIAVGKKMVNDLGLTNVNMFQADLLQLDESSKYDLIICMDVIEHIKDDRRLVANLYEALKPGGSLYLSTPHSRHINRHLKRFGVTYESKTHVRPGYSEKELSEILKEAGFAIVRLKNIWGLWGEMCEEIYQLVITRLPLLVAALLFPVLVLLSSLDMFAKNRTGYGLLLIAEKGDAV